MVRLVLEPGWLGWLISTQGSIIMNFIMKFKIQTWTRVETVWSWFVVSVILAGILITELNSLSWRHPALVQKGEPVLPTSWVSSRSSIIPSTSYPGRIRITRNTNASPHNLSKNIENNQKKQKNQNPGRHGRNCSATSLPNVSQDSVFSCFSDYFQWFLMDCVVRLWYFWLFWFWDAVCR